jgi:hypothetical protein
MSELDKCKAVMDSYLDRYVAEPDSGMKAIWLGKAAYWSIEADIEAYWEDFWKRKQQELEVSPVSSASELPVVTAQSPALS